MTQANAKSTPWALGVVWLAAAVYALVLCMACHTKFVNYGYGDFDLAVHSQSMWNILHGSFDSSILGIPFLGNHMVLILFLLAPLYGIFSSPLMLLYLQTIALAAGAFGIYRIASQNLPEWLATALSVVYLLYPPLIYLNLYEFHPIALAVPLLIWMLCFYHETRFTPFLGCMVLSLMCQENVALIILAFSFCALLDRRRGKWFWTPFVSGLVYFCVVVLAVMPRLNNNTIQFGRLYNHLGNSPSEILCNSLLHPIRFACYMLEPAKLMFVNSLLSPLAYLSLLSPFSLLPALPALAQRLLSSRITESSIAYHYQAEFIPFVFYAAIFGAKRILAWKHRLVRPTLAIALIVLPLVTIIAGGVPGALLKACRSSPQQASMRARNDAVLASIPDQASVLSTFTFLPKLANRSSLYSLHHVYIGGYTLSDVAYPTPETDFLIMDTADALIFSHGGFYSPDSYIRLQKLITQKHWSVLSQCDTLLALKRGQTDDPQLPLAKAVQIPSNINRNVHQEWSEPFPADAQAMARLVGFNVSQARGGDTALLTLYWEESSMIASDFDMFVVIKSSRDRFYCGVLSPGSRIWAPQSWPVGVLIADVHRIHPYSQITSPDELSLEVLLSPVR
jgi:uncharacterized membrane protein